MTNPTSTADSRDGGLHWPTTIRYAARGDQRRISALYLPTGHLHQQQP